MYLLAMNEPPVIKQLLTTPLEGVTTAIVLFLFACVAMPNLIKNLTQYYVALWCTLGILVVNTLIMIIPSTNLIVFGGFLIGLLQITAVLMLVLCAGGMSLKSMAGEMKGAYEVIRRGEEEKEVIIPRSGQVPKQRDEDEAAPVIHLTTPKPQEPPPRIELE
jgi:hypothetical protein